MQTSFNIFNTDGAVYATKQITTLPFLAQSSRRQTQIGKQVYIYFIDEFNEFIGKGPKLLHGEKTKKKRDKGTKETSEQKTKVEHRKLYDF